LDDSVPQLLDIVRDHNGDITAREAVEALERTGSSPASASEALLDAVNAGAIVIGKAYKLELVG
jgi:hypothetical protein